MLAGRQDLLANGQADWAMGEAFAFGSLLEEGYHVRCVCVCVCLGTCEEMTMVVCMWHKLY